jgi:competence ComEA-like helix-hairpin-helix protein
MSDAFNDFLAKRETQQKASAASSQRWFMILIVLAVLVVFAIVIFRGDPSTRPVNPNTASIDQLISLPEVGPEMAQRIVAKRAEKKFTKAEDLLDVKGIGPKTLAKMKPRLQFDEPK